MRGRSRVIKCRARPPLSTTARRLDSETSGQALFDHIFFLTVFDVISTPDLPRTASIRVCIRIMSDQVIRYPYLVTPAAPVPSEMSSPSPSLSPSTLVGDIDMEATSTTSDSKLQSAPTYIALDTNILIYHLRLVKQVYAVLNALSPVTHHLLIPSTVINGECDFGWLRFLELRLRAG